MEELYLDAKAKAPTNYKCHKQCDGSANKEKRYDSLKLQKLKEIFNFDYLIEDSKGSKATGCCHSQKKAEKVPSGLRNYTYGRVGSGAQEDDFLYVSLETCQSSSYPLSLPPPRSDSDIVPVSSSISSCQPSIRDDVLKGKDNTNSILDAEKQILLHDLFSGDIYEN